MHINKDCCEPTQCCLLVKVRVVNRKHMQSGCATSLAIRVEDMFMILRHAHATLVPVPCLTCQQSPRGISDPNATPRIQIVHRGLPSPGVFETFASELWLVSVLTSDDLPTLERPITASSGRLAGGHCSSVVLLFTNVALLTRVWVGCLGDMMPAHQASSFA